MGIFSSKQKQAVNTGPWAPQQPYVMNLFGRAEDLWQTGGPEYYPGQTLADRNPLINQSEDQIMDYFGGPGVSGLLDTAQGATQDMLGGGVQGYQPMFDDPNVGGAYQQLLSGDPNPYIGDAAKAVRDDMAEDYWGIGGMASQIRDNQVASGQYGGSSRSDLMNRRALDELDENQRQATAGMYANAFENAQNRMGQGLSLAENTRSGMGNEAINRYSVGIGQTPTLFNLQQTAMGIPGQVGQDRMAYDQASIDDQVQRHNYNANLPWTNLQNYQGFVTGNYGAQGNTVNQSRDSAYNIGKGLFNDAVGLATIGAGLF